MSDVWACGAIVTSLCWTWGIFTPSMTTGAQIRSGALIDWQFLTKSNLPSSCEYNIYEGFYAILIHYVFRLQGKKSNGRHIMC